MNEAQAAAADVAAQVRRQFSDVASNYRYSQVHAAGADLDMLVAAAQPTSDSFILDAGCGAGHTALALAARAGTVIACDFTRAMLDQVEALARERGIDNIIAQQADVERLPCPASSIDIVATRYSAHHWLHPERALAEFARVLKPGGTFVISDIMAREDYAQDSFLQTIELLRDPSHVRDYRISEWLDMLEASGFAVDAPQRFELTLRFATWAQRMRTPPVCQAAIKALFAGASADIRRGFHLPAQIPADDDFTFVIPGAVIRASLPPT